MKIIRPFLIARPLIIGIVATTFLLFSSRNAVALDQLNSLSAFEDEWGRHERLTNYIYLVFTNPSSPFLGIYEIN